MATHTATLSRPMGMQASAGVVLPAFTLWWREIVRFYRQPTRVVGVLASPLVFWLVIGSGFGTSFRSGGGPGQQHYLDYFYPGALIMIVLFTSIFTMMSVIEDRKEGFLLSVLVAPVPRSAIVLGKVLGGTTLSAVQGMIFLIFAPFAGVHLEPLQVLLVAVVVFLVSFSLTALGFAIAWPMDSSQAFHGIVNLFLIPLWLVSGALFPLAGASGWIRIIMRLNPLTYGVEALRGLFYPGAETSFPLPLAMATLALFSLINVRIGLFIANRAVRGPPLDRRKFDSEQYAYFPALNASLNGASAVLLLAGRVLIARGRIAAHRACMIAAVVASALFLACYLYFHWQVGIFDFLGAAGGGDVLDDSDPARHACDRDCSAGNYHTEPGAEGALPQHRAIARWTWPLWMYVSVTGVIVYFMLYQWFPHS